MVLDNVLQVIYGVNEKSVRSRQELLHLNKSDTTASVVPADFDGDLATDLLFTTIKNDGSRLLNICYGTSHTTDYSRCSPVKEKLAFDPFVFE